MANIKHTKNELKAQREAQGRDVRAALDRWVRLFAEPVALEGLSRVTRVLRGEANIAGVTIPVFKDVIFERNPLDLFETPSWLDDAADVLEQLVQIAIAMEVLREQKRLIAEELRTTSQRVNLFEKVKIPEAREHIRQIKIFLGDQQTAGVARAKFAKGRAAEFDANSAVHSGAEVASEEEDRP